MSARDVVVFLGPTLPLATARKTLRARYLPPARQGDVFRVLPSRPKVIVLIDGVFEAVPSVWHHELRAALASGVHVIGASSMGALRAAELHAEGMLPVGRIAGDYVSGARTDDADVVLLHGDADSKYQALTVPLVNVEATLAEAARQRVLTRREASAFVAHARGVFYKQRTWRALVHATPRWSEMRRAEVLAWLRSNVVDQKARDAVLALQTATTLARRPPRAARVATFSSFVRRRRLMDAHGETMRALQALPDADALAKQGLRRLLLASFAKAAGLTVEVPSSTPGPRGVAVDDALADAEVTALEALVLSAPERFVPDGPGWLEGLALEARLSGRWPRR
ncbi:MAG: TfuA-like protein [Myxococcales bacterium]|nr:TfuA-like protein [Myxococcales bacterium]